SIDVTELVVGWLDGSIPEYGLALLPSASNDVSVSFDSKENTVTSHPAELEIVLAGPVGPTGATGLAGPPGPTGPMGAQGPVGAIGPTGSVGPTGAPGAVGPTGSQGGQGPIGPTGPAGTSVVAMSIAPGAECPTGGSLFVTGGVTTYACN